MMGLYAYGVEKIAIKLIIPNLLIQRTSNVGVNVIIIFEKYKLFF